MSHRGGRLQGRDCREKNVTRSGDLCKKSKGKRAFSKKKRKTEAERSKGRVR